MSSYRTMDVAAKTLTTKHGRKVRYSRKYSAFVNARGDILGSSVATAERALVGDPAFYGHYAKWA